jgi:3-isopropylmalate/(R)-2-methylmalate dehydratase small subunit
VGESFSEIFFGNAVALGMPCVTAARADIDALLSLVESQPGLELTVDLVRLEAAGADRPITIGLPPAARESFLDGTWDATALLLDDYAAVRRVAGRLPYLTGW